MTAKSVQSEAASASSPTPISLQLTSDVIAGTRGARLLWQAASAQGGNNDTSHRRARWGDSALVRFDRHSQFTRAVRQITAHFHSHQQLWFWPIEAAELLPDRDQFLNEIALVLTGSVYQPDLGPNQTADLFGVGYAEHAADIARRISNEIGMLDLDRLFKQFPRLKFVDDLAHRHRFHHWELAFADLFYGETPDGRARGGFDLILGNPPWVKVRWEEGGVLGDYNPLFVLRGHSANVMSALRGDTFERHADVRSSWLTELEEAEATQAFLNSRQNYPLLAGQQTNLYKCFLPQAWMIGSSDGGVAGFLHPEGVFDDPKGGEFREELYQRLRAHFQFQNEKKLFSEVHHETLFSINVYGKTRLRQ